MKNFNFTFNSKVIFGNESRFIINKILSKNNYNRVGLVIDHALVGIPIINELLNSIKAKITLIECDISEPTYDKLEEKRINSIDKKIDLFIGLGGGSALDMAKGLSVLYFNTKPAIYYRGFEKYTKSVLPVIAIPTTAGTGSEITPNASFIDTNEERKLGINGEKIRPQYSILDPELTLSCPLNPTISAGVDSMVHATEAFVATKTNIMAKMFAKEGFNLVLENLPLLVNDLGDKMLRENVMYGAFLSAIALMNSGTGPAAAMSYPLGVRFKVPHGIGGGIFLPSVVEHNINLGIYQYSDIIRSNFDNESNEKKSNIFLENMWNVWAKLNVPQDLSKYGMNKIHIDKFISDTMELKGALDQNPVPFYENEIRSTLQKLLMDSN